MGDRAQPRLCSHKSKVAVGTGLTQPHLGEFSETELRSAVPPKTDLIFDSFESWRGRRDVHDLKLKVQLKPIICKQGSSNQSN